MRGKIWIINDKQLVVSPTSEDAIRAFLEDSKWNQIYKVESLGEHNSPYNYEVLIDIKNL